MSAALIESGYLSLLTLVASFKSMWSMAGITIAILGVPREKNNVASLKTLGKRLFE